MNLEEWTSVARIISAITSVILAILAIWGPKIRAAIAGPKLEINLRDTKGNPTNDLKGIRRMYYHLRIRNKRRWSPAKNVRILLNGIQKREPDGSYRLESLLIPLQLRWVHGDFHELQPTILDVDHCDLGFIREGDMQFRPSLYYIPNNFRGYLEKGQSARLSIIASAHNYVSEKPLVLEMSWDGIWTDDKEEMEKHFVIKDVSDKTNRHDGLRERVASRLRRQKEKDE